MEKRFWFVDNLLLIVDHVGSPHAYMSSLSQSTRSILSPPEAQRVTVTMIVCLKKHGISPFCNIPHLFTSRWNMAGTIAFWVPHFHYEIWIQLWFYCFCKDDISDICFRNWKTAVPGKVNKIVCLCVCAEDRLLNCGSLFSVQKEIRYKGFLIRNWQHLICLCAFLAI